jgi:hypothetical protein
MEKNSRRSSFYMHACYVSYMCHRADDIRRRGDNHVTLGTYAVPVPGSDPHDCGYAFNRRYGRSGIGSRDHVLYIYCTVGTYVVLALLTHSLTHSLTHIALT